MVSFVIEFVETAFQPDDLEEEGAMIVEIRSKLGTCNAVVDHRWSEIKDEVAKQYSTVFCPNCQQSALSADGGTVRCLFCYYSTDSETAANDYVGNVLGVRSRYATEKDGDEWPIRICPDCGHETFVTQIPGPYDTQDAYCFNCGQEYSGDEIEQCYECGELYDCGEERGYHICRDCFRAKVMKDD
jgi:hypothetical protein